MTNIIPFPNRLTPEIQKGLTDNLFLKHFHTYLTLLRDTEVKLTQSGNLSRKALRDMAPFIDPDMTEEEIKNIRTQDDWDYVTILTVLAQILKFTQNRKGFRKLIKRGKSFLEKPLMDQYLILFEVYVEEFNWCYLYPFFENDYENPARFLQMHFGYIIHMLLASASYPDGWMSLEGLVSEISKQLEFSITTQDGKMDRTRFLIQMVIIRYFKVLGILNFQRMEKKGFSALDKIQLTPLGHYVLSRFRDPMLA